MAAFFDQVLTLLTTSPGNLTYHLVLAFSIAGALQACFYFWRNTGLFQGRRMLIGLALLLLARLGLFLAGGLAWDAVGVSPALLPTLDRAVTVFSLVLIVWLWAFPEPMRMADAATVLLSLLVVTVAAFTLVWWVNQGQMGAFNGSPPDLIWEGFALFLIFAASLMLLTRRPNGWETGLGMLILLFAGHLAHLLAPLSGSDFPGAVRLAQMAAYPLLLTLPQRFPQPAAAPQLIEELAQPAILESPPAGIDPQVIQALLALVGDAPPADSETPAARLIAQAMPAEVCLLVSVPAKNGRVSVPSGYDLIADRYLLKTELDGRHLPQLVGTMRDGLPLRLPSGSTAPDLAVLGQTFDFATVGSVLAAPIQVTTTGTTLGAVLLAPYSQRDWTKDDEELLLDLAGFINRLLQRSQEIQDLQAEIGQAQDANLNFQTQIEQLQRTHEEMLEQMDILQQSILAGQVDPESLIALLTAQETAEETIQRLQSEVESLRQAAGQVADGGTKAASEEVAYLEGELRLALEEVARLRAVLMEVNQAQIELAGGPVPGGKDGHATPVEREPGQPPAMAAAGGEKISKEQMEVIAAIVQELRQPMSSLIGYTELLLGESVGILGALQRKFMERIKASTERMGYLIEDLVQIIALDTGALELAPEPVELNTVIDEAITNTEAQIREKDIKLRVELPEGLPSIQADRDALQQVLIHLLRNASAATKAEGEIEVKARVEREEGKPDYLLMQVTDQGGGIPAEEQNRVFSRLYRADNALIQGVGDTGVGLSIVKALVEAHKGRVWVDSHLGSGSTFSVLLPVSAEETRFSNRRGAPE